MIFHTQADKLRLLLRNEDVTEFEGNDIEICEVDSNTDSNDTVLWETSASNRQFFAPKKIFGEPADPVCLSGVVGGHFVVPRKVLRRVNDAKIIGNTGVIARSNKLFCPDPVSGEEIPTTLRYAQNYHGFVFLETGGKMRCAFVRRSEPFCLPYHAIFFHNLESGNYGSFLFRVLPQMCLFRTFLLNTPGFSFDCYITPRRTPWFLDALKLNGLPVRPIFEVQEVLGDTVASVTFFNEFDAEGFFSEDTLEGFSYLIRVSGITASNSTIGNIFVSRRLTEIGRRDYRRLRNAAHVESQFSQAGFRTVFPEALTFSDQVSIFAGSTRIAGPSGSGMLNSAFSKPNSRVLDIESFTYNVRQHAKIYSSTQKQYAFLFGDVDVSDELPLAARNWTIPKSTLTAAIAWLRSTGS